MWNISGYHQGMLGGGTPKHQLPGQRTGEIRRLLRAAALYGRPRGMIKAAAAGKIEDTGPMTRKRMETVDDEVLEASLGRPF